MSVHAARLAAQLLSGPAATSVDDVVGRLLAVQAQELRGARLAVRSRSQGLSAVDVDAALADRSLVVDWLNRGTLHLVRAEDHAWLHALTTPQLATTSARRLAQEGVPPEAAERGVAAVVRALEGGPRVRADLREAVLPAGVPVAGQALVHVLLLASLRGHVVAGPVVGTEQAFVLRRDWLGPAPAVDREAALVELARRYLAGHGPASAADLARWAGLGLGDARRGLAGSGAVEVDGLLDLPGRADAPPLPPPRLLGTFEPVLLGWTSRADVVGDHPSLVTSNGVFRALALVEGRAVATWSLTRDGVGLTPLEPYDDDVAAALARDAAEVLAFLGR